MNRLAHSGCRDLEMILERLIDVVIQLSSHTTTNITNSRCLMHFYDAEHVQEDAVAQQKR